MISSVSSSTHTVGDPPPPVLGSIPIKSSGMVISNAFEVAGICTTVSPEGEPRQGAHMSRLTVDQQCNAVPVFGYQPACSAISRPVRQASSRTSCSRAASASVVPSDVVCSILGGIFTGAWSADDRAGPHRQRWLTHCQPSCGPGTPGFRS
jgi:hypothetical protein